MKNQARHVFPLLCAAATLVIGSVWFTACASAPTSVEMGERAHRFGYANVASIPGIRIYLPYQHRDNVAKRAFYPPNLPCIANRGTVQKLAQVQQTLAAQGYGLLIWDAWRPPEAQQALWDAVRNPKYVIPPSAFLSRHCYGIAVDVSLVDRFGRKMRMPTDYDEFTEAASSTYRGADPEIARNLEILQKAMKSAGFKTIPDEWWHFEDRSPTAVKLLNAKQMGLRIK